MAQSYDGLESYKVPGIPAPIYTMYRATPIGEALQNVLNDFKDARMINDKQKELLLAEFDKQMTASMCNLPEEEFRITQGQPIDNRFVSDYYEIVFKPAVIQFSDGAVSVKDVDIVAVRGIQKELEEQPKKGRRK